MLATLCDSLSATAAEPPATPSGWTSVSPQSFGLDIPAAAVVAGRGERVLTSDESGRAAVGRVYVRVGQHLIVTLPDGQLVARPADQCPETDRPFEIIDNDLLARQLSETEFPGWRTHQTRRYVYVYQSSEAFVEVASRILETMFRGIGLYSQAQKIDVTAPEFPLVVVVYRTQQEFRQARRVPDGVVAYYDVLTNRVSMCEESDLWRVKPDLAIRQTIATIAHEGAHQILHNIGVQQRLSVWPMWLNEGLAEFFAPTTTDQRLKWKGAGEVNDLRMFELEQLLKSRTADTADGQLIAQTIGAARLTSTGYAMAWALTHYLAQNQRESFHAFVRATAARGALTGGGDVVSPGVIPGNLRDFKQHFGEDLADIERRVMLHLRRQPYLDPFLDWPHFAALILMPNGARPRREAEVFHLPEQAERWREQRLAQLPDGQRAVATHEIREFPNRLIAEQFVRQWRQSP